MPYTKLREKNNFSQEVNNHETFDKILEIFNENHKNIDLEFSFVGTGIAQIRKLTDDELKKSKKIDYRKITMKNLMRKIILKLKISLYERIILKTQKKINFFNIRLKISDLLFLFREIMGGRSYMRATHNLYLKKNLSLKNLTADLGSGKKNSYKKLIFENIEYVENFDFYQTNRFTEKVNLEKKIYFEKI